MPIKKLLIGLFLVFSPYFLFGQVKFYGSNLMEFQLGNLPSLEPKDQFSIYDQLNAGLRYKKFTFQTRIEQYWPSFEPAESYINLSQLKFQYISRHVEVQVGNHYSSLGRGLLLRTYDIPASIWETRGYRVRYGFYKDLLGAMVKLNFNDLEVKLLGGKPLDVTMPPTIDERKNRRPNLLGGVETSYRFGKQKAGIMYMRNETTSPDEVSHFGSVYFDGSITDKVFLYTELASRFEEGVPIFSSANGAGFGIYSGLNYSAGQFGASLEYKYYNNFYIGAGINDPPTLVKEHSYRLLNRSTHVPILSNESGYQAEIYYRMENGNFLTFNTSLSKNRITDTFEPVFIEFFSEYQVIFNDNISGKFFADYSEDPLMNEIHRYAVGSYIDVAHKKLNSTFELETQLINRMTSENIHFYNWYFDYSLSKASKFTASILLEITQDPIHLVDDNMTNIFPSVSFSYHLTRKNILNLFAGKRRGGPACNSGVCYDVLDFQGLEIRMLSRF